MANILVVDDSDFMKRNLKIWFKNMGHTVVGEASNGRQALDAYQEFKPDIITMDITMPKMDGVEAVKEIMAGFPEAKIIMITASDQKSLVLDALKSGAKHYIVKPVDLKKLESVMNQVL